MPSKLFLTLLPLLLFSLNLNSSIISADPSTDYPPHRYISYGILTNDKMTPTRGHQIQYGHRRLLKTPPPTPLKINLIKDACQDDGIDVNGKNCTKILRSFSPSQSDTKNLAIFTLQETQETIANNSIEFTTAVTKAGPILSLELGLTVQTCFSSWLAQASGEIEMAIQKLKSNSKVDAVVSIKSASSHVRACYWDMQREAFLIHEESRHFVNNVNRHNEFLKTMLGAATYLSLH